MATPVTSEERGLGNQVTGAQTAVATGDRGTGNKGVPPVQREDADRIVIYRFEYTLPTAPDFWPPARKSPRSETYPFWRPVPIPRGTAAPERMKFGTGVEAFRAEPDWQGPPEAGLSAPPLVAAEPQPPRKQPQPAAKAPKPQPAAKAAKPPPIPEAAKPEPAKPQPKGPVICPPGYMPTKSGRACTETPEMLAERDREFRQHEFERAVRDYADATLGEGFENAAKVAKWASLIPGPAGRIFKGIGTAFQTIHDAYEGAKLVRELIVEMSQPDALEKGSKELAKKSEDAFMKYAEKKLDKILKRKGIVLPDEIKKQIIKKAREFFDKNIRDPAIEKGKKEFEKRMDPKERSRSLWEEWSRGLPVVR